jgi:hypothetical protein
MPIEHYLGGQTISWVGRVTLVLIVASFTRYASVVSRFGFLNGIPEKTNDLKNIGTILWVVAPTLLNQLDHLPLGVRPRTISRINERRLPRNNLLLDKPVVLVLVERPQACHCTIHVVAERENINLLVQISPSEFFRSTVLKKCKTKCSIK